MSTCAVLGCSHNQMKNKNKSFFRLPTTPEIKKAWLNPINCKESNLPHKVVICLDHFEEQCLTVHGDYRMSFITVIIQ